MSIIANILRTASGHFQIRDTWKKRVFKRILDCGTGALGVTTYKCENAKCGHEEKGGATCGSRNCPNCGGTAREKWVDKTFDKLFPVPHFHMVFTLPHELNTLVAAHERTMLDLLMTSVSATLLDFSNKHLKGKPAFIMVLHTWTQTLRPHYHVHVAIAAGAFSDGKWQQKSSKYLFPVHSVAKVFRGIFLETLCDMIEGKDPKNKALKGFRLSYIPKKWHVYCGPPYKDSSNCMKYFANYANRVGTSNSRIIGTQDGLVKIAYKRDPYERDKFEEKESAEDKKRRFFTLSIIEFAKLFVIHILPKSFLKIRYGGLYHARSSAYKTVNEAFLKVKACLKALNRPKLSHVCPKCRKGLLRFIDRSSNCTALSSQDSWRPP